MSSTDTGREAEKHVANLLIEQGHKIVELNWRTRWCEIDIVSKTKDCVYFTEVKYRASDAWGDGFSYITPAKLKQMKFAAELWLSANKWEGECVLQAASVDVNLKTEIIEIFD
jgi:uncharacterized protein (TIGR00252 family)